MALDIDKTIQSQYASSPRIKALVRAFFNLIDPTADITLFYNNIFNLETASGYGLDVWGRIVGIGRKISGMPSSADYFGFDPLPVSEQVQPYDQAPFYSEQYPSSTYSLQDAAYRLLINTKAMANIGTGSLADLNRQLKYLLPNVDAGVINIGTMKIRIYVIGTLQVYEKLLLKRGDLPPIPTGVGTELLVIPPDTFGFEGSGLQTFDNGTFYDNESREML